MPAQVQEALHSAEAKKHEPLARLEHKLRQRGWSILAFVVFIAIYAASLYASSGTVRFAADSAEAHARAVEHIIYSSEEGPPDEVPVPVLSQHPVHGAEVRSWRTRNGTQSSQLSREAARLDDLEDSYKGRLGRTNT